MRTINNRNNFADLLTDLKLTGEAAFVGTAEAQFEFWFLDRWPGRANFIDPYRILDAPGFSGHGESDDAGQEARYQRILRQSQKYGDHCKILRMTSEQAAPRFADGSLDFCYLDAQHDYPSIKRDLELWHPKVKPGSILAGHDWVEDGIHNGQSYGVKQAVRDFAIKYGKVIHFTHENDWPSWWIQI